MIEGPFLAGSQFRRNTFNDTFNTTVAVPAKSTLFLVLGTDTADTGDITVSDGTPSNDYQAQVNSQQPGTLLRTMLFIVPQSLALPIGRTITITSSIRGDFGSSLYYFTGARGFLTSTTVEWRNVANPSASLFGRAGNKLFAAMALAGPSSDTFTQDGAWGADVVSNIQSTTLTVHGTSRDAPTDGDYTYAPTLSDARQSVMVLASFQ